MDGSFRLSCALKHRIGSFIMRWLFQQLDFSSMLFIASLSSCPMFIQGIYACPYSLHVVVNEVPNPRAPDIMQQPHLDRCDKKPTQQPKFQNMNATPAGIEPALPKEIDAWTLLCYHTNFQVLSV